MTDRPVVLGLQGGNHHTHDSAAALVIGGETRFAAAEERFDRVKHTHAFPAAAARAALGFAGLELRDVDLVAVPFSRTLRLFGGALVALRRLPDSLPGIRAGLGPAGPLRDLRDKSSVLARLAAAFDGETPRERPRLREIPHHHAHAAAAFYPSPFERAAILTVDGIGETASVAIFRGEGTRILPVWTQDYPDSLGFLYRAVTTHLGFRGDRDEGTVMALAATGDDRFLSPFLALVRRRRSGGFRLDPRYFRFFGYPGPDGASDLMTPAFARAFVAARRAEDPLRPEHAALARALQEVTTRALLDLARFAVERTGCGRLCLGGGVALNCAANGVLLDSGRVEDLFVPPAAGDDGAALGAALAAAHAENPALPRESLVMPFHGPAFEDEAFTAAAARGVESAPGRLAWSTPGDLPERVADLLAAGRIVARFTGRAEFGPRALGNRSILADPRDAATPDRLNALVKRRLPFRPYAPAVLAAAYPRYFLGAPASPHMLVARRARAEASRAIPAVIHTDGTARAQCVEPRDNPGLASILAAFGARTGVPVLLNTSFNGPGEPIVGTPDEALATFLSTGIDALVLGSCLLEKTFPVADVSALRAGGTPAPPGFSR